LLIDEKYLLFFVDETIFNRLIIGAKLARQQSQDVINTLKKVYFYINFFIKLTIIMFNKAIL